MIFGKINCAVTNLVFKTSVCYRKVSEKLEFILRHIALIKGRYHLKMEQELYLVFISMQGRRNLLRKVRSCGPTF